MSSETDHPRQRTVAELLAEHGAAGAATGRRRRRRESDGDGGEPVDVGTPAPPVNGGAPAPPVNGGTPAPPVNGAPPPHGSSAPLPNGSSARPPHGGGGARPPHGGGARPPNGGGAPPLDGAGIAPAAWAFPPSGPPAGPGPDRSILREPVPQEPAREERRAREFAPRAYVPEPEPPRANPPRRGREVPTEHLPRYREERTGALDPGLTGPIEQLPRPAPSLDEPTVEGIQDGDGGPPTMAGAAPVAPRRRAGTRPRSDDDDEAGPATQAAVMPDFDDDDDHPAGPDEVEEPRRRLGRSAGTSSPGQAWAAVVAQWIVGAIGGAALWVGFRFLWRELPVVALAAAVLVTVGLVLIVRALLRNNDMRTTVFAVLVGLLLTVSPAILVLLGR